MICSVHNTELVEHANGHRNGKPRPKRLKCPTCHRETLTAKRATYRTNERARGTRTKVVRPLPDPEKRRRRGQIAKLIRKGVLVPQPCERCGLGVDKRDAAGRRLVYAVGEPHAVVWLCASCAGVKRQTIQPDAWELTA